MSNKITLNLNSNKPVKEKVGSLINYINSMNDVMFNMQDILDDIEVDDIVSLIEVANDNSRANWVFVSDLLSNVHKRSKYGDKAIDEIAKEVGMSRSYCFELLKINDQIFKRDSTLRESKFLTVTHFTNAIRNAKDPEDAIDYLKEADDQQLSAKELTMAIKNQNPDIRRDQKTEYFEITPIDKKAIEDKQWQEQKKLASNIYLMTDLKGVKYLEVKTYKYE